MAWKSARSNALTLSLSLHLALLNGNASVKLRTYNTDRPDI